MIKFIQHHVHTRKIKKLLRKKFSPDPAFLEAAKADFLSRISGTKGIAVPVRKRFGWMLKYSVTFAIIVGLGGGLVAYADAQNVPPTHPLYPLKRLGEDITLTFASSGSKPYLHREFAERRLEEIEEVSSAASSTKKNQIVKTLDDDFKTEVNEAFTSAKKKNVKIDAISFCSSFGDMISKSGKKSRAVVEEASWESFQKYCGGTPSDFKIELE
ncbi:DUF5667 domain-containing protein [Patescibacteria group bacterium]|nr:DUF5667 domain-containing protein [Patescibacteria group bacterium]MCL5114519.1 DUF5667 domain-containing protein [Patescibacteria group bacterium]